MGTTEKKLLDLISSDSSEFNNTEVHAFEKALAEFKRLVQQGLVKERGYNLAPMETAHLQTAEFNTIEL